MTKSETRQLVVKLIGLVRDIRIVKIAKGDYAILGWEFDQYDWCIRAFWTVKDIEKFVSEREE